MRVTAPGRMAFVRSSLLALPLLASAAGAQTVVYVDAAAAPGGDGRAWGSAFTRLEDAIAAGGYLGSIQVWVARGIYRPAAPGGPRTSTFTLRNQMEILGGFAGTETDVRQRDPLANPVVLSGDLNGDDGSGARSDNCYVVVTGASLDVTCRVDGVTVRGGQSDDVGQRQGGGLRLTNSSAVFTACRFVDNRCVERGGAVFAVGSPATFEGCVFDSNRVDASGALNAFGAAVVNQSSTPTYRSCVFTNNVSAGQAASFAGAMYNNAGAAARVIGCVFQGNTATFGGAVANDAAAARFDGCVFRSNSAIGESGGAVYNQYSPLASFARCTFVANHADDKVAGAVYNFQSPTGFTNCGFFGNTARYLGAAMYNRRAIDVRVVGCSFIGNRLPPASSEGGAVACDDGTVGSFAQCTFARNQAAVGGGLLAASLAAGPTTTVSVVNSILQGNTGAGAEANYRSTGTAVLTFTFTDAAPAPAGAGNFNLDPLFYDLPGQDGIVGTEDDLPTLSSGSPCLEAGSAAGLPADAADLDGDGDALEPLPYDVRGRARVLDDDVNGTAAVNLGAYEASVRAWSNTSGGIFGRNSDWRGGSDLSGVVLPGAAPNAASDVFFSLPIASYSVQFRTATTQVRHLTATRAQLDFNLRDGGIELLNNDPALRSLDVSGTPGAVLPDLTWRTTSAAPRTVRTLNAVIGSTAGTSGAMHVTSPNVSLTVLDLLSVGASGAGVLTLEAGSISSALRLEVGGASGGVGTLALSGQARLDLGEGALLVGGAGTGTLTIGAGSRVVKAADPNGNDRVVLADLPASAAALSIDGAGAELQCGAFEIFLGNSGRSAAVSVVNGGVLRTTSDLSLVLAKERGSTASVSVGPGSSWIDDGFARLDAGPSGASSLAVDGVLAIPNGIVNHPRSSVSGAGVITSPSLQNFGVIRPGAGTGAGAVGSLTLSGRYDQIGLNNGASTSGRMEIDLRGRLPSDADRLTVGGVARLAGGLIASAQVFTPQLGDRWTIVSAGSVVGRFDVALLPASPPGTAFTVDYQPAGVSLVLVPDSGDANLGVPLSYGLDGTPTSARAADVDGDGDADLVVACTTGPLTPGKLYTLINRGTVGGQWQGFLVLDNPPDTGLDPTGVTVARLNNDGSPDVAVINAVDGTLQFFANDGLGRFTSSRVIGVGDGPRSVVSADFDRDGRQDLAVTQSAANNVAVYRNGGGVGFNFTVSQLVRSGREPDTIDPVNPDQDKDADLVVGNLRDNSLSLLINTGGTLTAQAADLPVGGEPRQVRAADLDLDGRTDLITANGASGSVSILRGLGAAQFAPAVSIALGAEVTSIAPIDIDADGDLDLAAIVRPTPNDVPVVQIVRNDLQIASNPNDNRVTLSVGTALASSGRPPAFVLSDVLDQGERADLITLNDDGPRTDDSVTIRLSGAVDVCLADFNADGFVDFFDYIDFVGCFEGSSCPPGLSADFNGDGFVDFFDYLDFVDAFEAGC